MKKYLLLIPRMSNGGAERVMATIANNLCLHGEVEIVTLTDNQCFYKLNERVKLIGLGQSVNRKNKITLLVTTIIGGIKVFFSYRNVVNTWKPDVVLSFLQSANAIAVLNKMLGGRYRLVVSERCDPTVRNSLNKWFEYHFYKKSDAIVCQSNVAASFFGDDVQDKIHVIPNPISSDAIPELHVGSRRKVVVGVGRLDKQKNFEMLIKAFSRLPEEFSNYKLEIYGGGKEEENLQHLIEELDVKKKVKLMGIKPNVMHYISDAALYVMSSDYEGFPNALVEAMATGIPVISTDFSTGVARELIGEKNGKVVPVGDEEALRDAMINMLSAEDKWNEISLANREMLTILSEEAVMRKWREVLEL